MTKLANPIPLFLNADGGLMDGGYVYIGSAGQDPEANPIPVFFDEALTIVAPQPLRTMGGRIVNGAYPANVYFAATDYSMRTRDAAGVQADYSPSLGAAVNFQPLDADLTAIADQGTVAYGRGLLNLANQDALKAATGIPDPLPKAGGQVTGNITRQNAGVHAFWANPAITGGRIYLTQAGAADPTSQPGDVWYQFTP